MLTRNKSSKLKAEKALAFFSQQNLVFDEGEEKNESKIANSTHLSISSNDENLEINGFTKEKKKYNTNIQWNFKEKKKNLEESKYFSSSNCYRIYKKYFDKYDREIRLVSVKLHQHANPF